MIAARTDLEWMELQVRALYAFDAAGRIVGFNEATGVEPRCPKVFVGRTRVGSVGRVRFDIDAELEELIAGEPGHVGEGAPRCAALVRAAVGPVEVEWSGPAFRFGERLPSVATGPGEVRVVADDEIAVVEQAFPAFAGEMTARAPAVALFEDGHVQSMCFCATGPGLAVEAGVETLAAARGRGFAPHGTRSQLRERSRARAERLVVARAPHYAPTQ